jgi:hypothetical protein
MSGHRLHENQRAHIKITLPPDKNDNGSAAIDGLEGSPSYSDLERQFDEALYKDRTSMSEPQETPRVERPPGLWLLDPKYDDEEEYWSLNEEFGGRPFRRIYSAQLRVDHPHVDAVELAARLERLDPENKKHTLKNGVERKCPMYGWSGLVRGMNIDPGEIGYYVSPPSSHGTVVVTPLPPEFHQIYSDLITQTLAKKGRITRDASEKLEGLAWARYRERHKAENELDHEPARETSSARPQESLATHERAIGSNTPLREDAVISAEITGSFESLRVRTHQASSTILYTSTRRSHCRKSLQEQQPVCTGSVASMKLRSSSNNNPTRMGTSAASQVGEASPSAGQSQTKDTVRRTRGGRICKSTTTRSTTVEGRRRPQRTTVTVAKAPIALEQSDRLRDVVNGEEEFDDKDVQVQQKGLCKMQQEKARIFHKPTRMSRRLQGLPPEVGVFSQQDTAASLNQHTSRSPSKGHKPIPFKGLKPRGVTKSGHDATNFKYRRQPQRLQWARES